MSSRSACVGALSEYSTRGMSVATRVLSFAGNMRGLSDRTWMSSSSMAVSVRASARAASLTACDSTRPAHASAWVRTSRRVSTAACTRFRRSCAFFAQANCSRKSSSVAWTRGSLTITNGCVSVRPPTVSRA